MEDGGIRKKKKRRDQCRATINTNLLQRDCLWHTTRSHLPARSEVIDLLFID